MSDNIFELKNDIQNVLAMCESEKYYMLLKQLKMWDRFLIKEPNNAIFKYRRAVWANHIQEELKNEKFEVCQ